MKITSYALISLLLGSVAFAQTPNVESEMETSTLYVETEAESGSIHNLGAWIVPIATVTVISIAVYLSSGKIE